MITSRLFISQLALDQWLGEGRAKIEGEELTDAKTKQRFRLITGVRFVSEVTGAPDLKSLVGTVKDADQLESLGAELLSGSVLLGDNAYEVQEGFVGTLVVVDVAKPKPRAQTIASLQAFFLNNVK
ncbi:MAG: hypothetical protein Q8Q09_14560 [Deltaproteobacteria bacterium]|nr:hypothetical protein [Deltaproteobacteria bacterium]